MRNAVAFATTALLLFVAACSNEEPELDSGCASDSACEADEICEQRRCLPGCTHDDQCETDGQSCVAGRCALWLHIEGALDTISAIQFSAGPESVTPNTAVQWTFGDDSQSELSAVPVEHRYPQLGSYKVSMSLELDGEPLTITRTVAINHPSYWPKILPTYYIGGFTEEPVEALRQDPHNTRAVMLSAFDLYKAGKDEVDTARIDALHAAGLLVYVDVAQWNPPWNDWDSMVPILVKLAQGGIDGVDFDEFGSGGPQLEAGRLNALGEQLRAVNPHLRLVVTQVQFNTIEALLKAGGKPDYVALEWYLSGASKFEQSKTLASDHGVRLAYWVDPTSFAKIPQTYAEANAVVLWSLCWQASTCSSHPQNTWLPWAELVPLLEGLGPGLE